MPEKIKIVTITVDVAADRTIKLLLAETVAKGATVHSLRTRRAGANRKTLLGKSIVNDANFEAASITLKQRQTDVVASLFFEHIEKASNVDPVNGFPVNLKDIDWNTSYIEIAEGVALNAGNVFELTISYTDNQ